MAACPGCYTRRVVLVVAVEHLGDRRVHLEPPAVEIQTARAEPAQVFLVVADEEKRAPLGEQLVDAAVALLAERAVTHGEHLGYEEDRLLQLRSGPGSPPPLSDRVDRAVTAGVLRFDWSH